MKFWKLMKLRSRRGKIPCPILSNALNQTINDPGLLQASIESDGSLLLQSAPDYKFIFGEDQPSITQVLGLNSFFDTLKGAEDIQLSEHIRENTNKFQQARTLFLEITGLHWKLRSCRHVRL
ncbi:MAG: hypothetical protein Ct9H300mP21_05010 [Pseudomonadota bacterium]|nr:MAG: hypothetical protein Ct9H300mP21_05010 [Pseudomonadota bacterium]